MAKDPQKVQDYYKQSLLEIKKLIDDTTNQRDKELLQQEELTKKQQYINELKKIYLEDTTLTAEKQTEILGIISEEEKGIRDTTKAQKEYNVELDKGIKKRQQILDLTKSLGQQLVIGWKYLQEQDKIIKSTVLNLGMSGAKAAAMRDSFNKSAGYVAMLGGSLADVQTIMEGYANETGRAQVLSAEMVQNIADIGKGTGLGIEQATRLGAQFEIMGIDAKSTMNYVQGVVDTSERMGVNTTKVLKTVNDNFKRLNTYTFQQGVKGFAQMAMYAEKFKIDIGQALNAADVARTLEGAIDLASQLQVMGGEFAKTDPFEMLFLSRNDPAKFTEKIADMTKGVVSFRKMADGSFEKYISPADRDRLAAVAKSMGMEASALTEIAQRTAEVQKMRQQMGGMGFSADVKEALEGAGKMNTETGKFQVKLGTTMVNITDLTKEQGESFLQQQVLLKDRAKQALTFDESFKATINSLKTALLPLLDRINKFLLRLTPTLDKFGEISGKGGLIKAASILLLGAGALKGAAWALSKAGSNWVATGNMFKGTGGKAATGGLRGFLSNGGAPAASPTGTASGLAEQRKGIGAGAAAAGKGKQMLGAGAGIGAAALGIGAGIGLAAAGISKLADSMSKLDKTQIWALPATVLALAGAFFVFTPAIIAVGTAGSAGALGLLALGASVLMIGAGIGVATMGIGKMAEGLGTMIEKSKDSGPAMLQVGAGIGAISLAMMGFTAGALGFLTFAATMRTIAKNAPAMTQVGEAFKQINAVMSGSKEDWIAIENAVKSISGMNSKGGGMLAELANLIKQPLKVEFVKGNVILKNDVTLQIDKTSFMHNIYDAKIAVQMQEELRR